MSSLTRRQVVAGGALIRLRRSAAQETPPSETVRIGIIGTGGRARRLMQSLDSVPGTRIAGLADIWDAALAQAAKLAPPGVFTTHHYKELLDRKDIDAVIIGSPDHWHVADDDRRLRGRQGRVCREAAHPHDRGRRESDRRTEPLPADRSGRHAAAQHAASDQGARDRQVGPARYDPQGPHDLEPQHAAAAAGRSSVDPKRVSTGRTFSAARQAAALRRLPLPQLALVLGFRRRHLHRPDGALARRRQLVCSTSTYRHRPLRSATTFTRKDVWETPDTVQTLLHYPDRKLQVYFEGTFVNQRNAAMTEFMGTEATLYIDRGRYEVIPERKRGPQGGAVPNQVPASEWILGEGPRGADFYANPDGEALHVKNWLECVRSRRTLSCPAEEGVKAANVSHLANIALRREQVARWKEVQA